MKIISIESCGECPGRQPYTKECVWNGIAHGTIQNTQSIPDWCPLEDCSDAPLVGIPEYDGMAVVPGYLFKTMKELYNEAKSIYEGKDENPAIDEIEREYLLDAKGPSLAQG